MNRPLQEDRPPDLSELNPGPDGPPAGAAGATSMSALVPVLWRDLPALLDDVGRALAGIDREYAAFLAEERLTVTAAAQVAVRELVETAEQRLSEERDPAEEPTAPSEPDPGGSEGLAVALFEEVGRDHARRNRPLLTLLLGFQAGGRVAWRHIAASAVRLGLPAEALAALAEAVFRAVDGISGVTTNGYLLEQAESGGKRERLLNALAEQMMVEGTDPARLQELAQQAGWALPAEAAVVLVRPDDHAGPTALARLVPQCLQVCWGAFPGLVVPDPRAPGARSRLAAQLSGCSAVVGPAVPLGDVIHSARVAADAVRAWGTAWAGQQAFFVDEHLDAVIVHRDDRLLDSLRAACLAPLQGAAKGSRAVFRDTLRSWLVHMGDRHAIAAELQVHPQTVRYRMSRLRELFGPVLDDPDGRLRLLLALAWDVPVGDCGTERAPRRQPGSEPDGRPVRRPPHGAPPARDRGGTQQGPARPAAAGRRTDGAGPAAPSTSGLRWR